MTSKSKLQEAFKIAPRICNVQRFHDSLSGSDATFFQNVLSDPAYGPAMIVKSLKSLGINDIGESAVKRHRVGACRCGSK